MAKVPYLFRQNNIFYFRTRIPPAYQESLKSKEVVLSLKTEDQAEAMPLALIITARFKASLLGIQVGKTDRLSYEELILSLNNETVMVTFFVEILSRFFCDFCLFNRGYISNS